MYLNKLILSKRWLCFFFPWATIEGGIATELGRGVFLRAEIEKV